MWLEGEEVMQQEQVSNESEPAAHAAYLCLQRCSSHLVVVMSWGAASLRTRWIRQAAWVMWSLNVSWLACSLIFSIFYPFIP